MVAGSFEKKKEDGVGVISRLSDSRLEGLTVLGLTCLISFWFFEYQERTPTTEKRIIIRGKNLRVFDFMLSIVAGITLGVKL